MNKASNVSIAFGLLLFVCGFFFLFGYLTRSMPIQSGGDPVVLPIAALLVLLPFVVREGMRVLMYVSLTRRQIGVLIVFAISGIMLSTWIEMQQNPAVIGLRSLFTIHTYVLFVSGIILLCLLLTGIKRIRVRTRVI
ncbi:hypothetical protein ADM98_08790 [Exiguobacterium sp. BMC-KP]|uniref:hypothetical protein n=1 Tax=Exiguobacterium sp. BMC-KP TaxID=1684312 RepID=UPI0006AA4103|nr:hypothetical protein [Exiguobacterium sp. BMC-KP]KOP29006.1 hypothetical protein ADM98_08790 [Exiguobacterium sp. BMC-KP]